MACIRAGPAPAVCSGPYKKERPGAGLRCSPRCSHRHPTYPRRPGGYVKPYKKGRPCLYHGVYTARGRARTRCPAVLPLLAAQAGRGSGGYVTPLQKPLSRQ